MLHSLIPSSIDLLKLFLCQHMPSVASVKMSASDMFRACWRAKTRVASFLVYDYEFGRWSAFVVGDLFNLILKRGLLRRHKKRSKSVFPEGDRVEWKEKPYKWLIFLRGWNYNDFFKNFCFSQNVFRLYLLFNTHSLSSKQLFFVQQVVYIKRDVENRCMKKSVGSPLSIIQTQCVLSKLILFLSLSFRSSMQF